MAMALTLAYACIYVALNVSVAGLGKDALRNVFSGILWGQGRQIWLYSAIAGVSAALIALILAGENWLVTFCRLPLLRPIGRISYGAYIFHLPVLWLYQFLLPSHGAAFSLTHSLGKFAFGYPATLLVSYLSFRYFEMPILKLRTRFA